MCIKMSKMRSGLDRLYVRIQVWTQLVDTQFFVFEKSTFSNMDHWDLSRKSRHVSATSFSQTLDPDPTVNTLDFTFFFSAIRQLNSESLWSWTPMHLCCEHFQLQRSFYSHYIRIQKFHLCLTNANCDDYRFKLLNILDMRKALQR